MTTVRPERAAPGGPAPSGVVLTDRFDGDMALGSVAGTTTPSGHERLVTDVEGRIGSDNGALRIRPLDKPGWGRCGVAYGPFDRRAGRVLVVRALNGHNASQTYYYPETRRQALRRRLGVIRRLGRTRRPHHYENFAVGWFDSPNPIRPERSGNGFVMHAADGDNGELWTRFGPGPLRAALGIQNVDIVYAVVLRERGATYYAASVDGAHALGDYPDFLPVAVDVEADEPQLYAGVHQRILGEVGYRVDTRVPWFSIVDDPALAPWHGGASIAHRLASGAEAEADAGPTWDLGAGVALSPDGLTSGTAGVGVVDPGETIGLVHAAIEIDTAEGSAGILVRGSGEGAWKCTVSTNGCVLQRRGPDLRWTTVATDSGHRARRGRRHHLQITDDGNTIGAHLDGNLLFDGWTTEADAGVTGVGVEVASGACVADFEAHARSVRLPLAVDAPGPWIPPREPVVVEDRFEGPAVELERSTTPTGAGWERVEGIGTIDVTGEGAKVRADVANPNPDRTIYAIDWHDPGFADLELVMTPPGTGRWQGQEGRAGLVLWQDDENYLVTNIFLDNLYDGASISTFYRCRGHEDMYDAVWTLVRNVHFGETCSLRIASDGERFLCYLRDRPSLFRAFTDVYPDAPPLQINKVGIVINREWGDDTGTVLHRFTARGPAPEVRR